MLNAILEGELEAHLDEEEREGGNRKNSKAKKQLRTSAGTIEVSTPRDRSGSFEPEMVKKRETIMAQSLEDKIIGLYGLGTSLRDISAHIKETYDTDISAATLSAITDTSHSPGKGMAAASLGRTVLHSMAGRPCTTR